MRHAAHYSLACLIMLAGILTWPTTGWAQVDDVDSMEKIERVAILQRQLDADEVAQREAAEKELISLGTMVLDHLEEPAAGTSSDALARLERVRLALEKVAIESVTLPGRMSFSGQISVADALNTLSAQTGNAVQMVEGTPDQILQKTLDLNLEKATFWETLNQISQQAQVEVSPYASQPGELRLSPRSDLAPGLKISEVPRDTTGIFETTVTQVSAARHLLQPQLDGYTILLRLRWEPRISPISIALPARTVKLIDEFDRPIKVSNPDAVFSGTVQREVPELEFVVPIQLVDRQVEVISSLEAELKTVLPGRVEKFKFRNLGRRGAGAKQTKAGVTVGFEGIRKNEDLFGVTVSIAFDDAKQSLESHLGWVYENKVVLVDDQGKEFQPLASESMGQTEDEVKIQYFFDQDPAPLTMIYETPAAIVSVPVKIRVQKIPLP